MLFLCGMWSNVKDFILKLLKKYIFNPPNINFFCFEDNNKKNVRLWFLTIDHQKISDYWIIKLLIVLALVLISCSLNKIKPGYRTQQQAQQPSC